LQTIVLILPMCLLKNIGELSYASLLSITSIGYLILLIIIESPLYIKNFAKGGIVYFNGDIKKILTAFVMILFAYSSQAGVFVMLSELYMPTLRRMHKVVGRSLTIDFIFYALISIFGYISTGSNTPDLITNRDAYKPGMIDYFMIVGRVFFFISVIIHIPINFHPWRRSFFNLLFGPKQDIEWKRYGL
jgi:amino acid permease